MNGSVTFKSSLLLGTPSQQTTLSGSAKSLFTSWLMCRLVKSAVTDISFREGANYFCSTRNGGTFEVYDAVRHGKPDHFFRMA